MIIEEQIYEILDTMEMDNGEHVEAILELIQREKDAAVQQERARIEKDFFDRYGGDTKQSLVIIDSSDGGIRHLPALDYFHDIINNQQ